MVADLRLGGLDWEKSSRDGRVSERSRYVVSSKRCLPGALREKMECRLKKGIVM